jgi:hypothetical protein
LPIPRLLLWFIPSIGLDICIGTFTAP